MTHHSRYESHWARFVSFCRTKRWHVFRVRSHHFSTYMMHLFREGLLPATIISHRTSVASVLRHWIYDPAADPHIKLLIRAFRLERLVRRRIMPKWDLHFVLSWVSLLPERFPCEESTTITGSGVDLRTGDSDLNPSEADRMLCPVMQLKLYLRDSEQIRGGGLSTTIHSFESQHQRYHEKSHQPMDRGDCEGSLHSS